MAEEAKAGEQDQSMEEILQSIKRIIAEEGDAPPPPAAPEAPKAAAFGSDVLELTDMIDEQKPIDPIDAIMAMTAPVVAPEPVAAAAPAQPAPEIPMEAASPASFAPPAPAAGLDADSLMSDVAVQASAAALRSLAGSTQHAPGAYVPSASASFRSGLTVEDLVIESLKPMLKEWLDANLPQIVERKVQREIERIARQSLG